MLTVTQPKLVSHFLPHALSRILWYRIMKDRSTELSNLQFYEIITGTTIFQIGLVRWKLVTCLISSVLETKIVILYIFKG